MLILFLISLFAGKMQNMCTLLNKLSKKVAGQSSNRKRDTRREVVATSEAWFHVRVLDDDPTEEDEIPLKRKKLAQ